MTKQIETEQKHTHLSLPFQDVLNMRINFLFSSGDDIISRDNVTVYDSIVLDEAELDSFSMPDGSCSSANDCCHTVDTSLQCYSGYVGIQYKPH